MNTLINEKMTKAIQSLESNLKSIRTGRANPTMLDRIEVEYYGSMTPINQVASISVVEGRQLVIKPFDKGLLKDIERAIGMSDLGIAPQNDGTLIRLMVPALTEERRTLLSKDASKMGEEAKVAIRNIRRDAMDSIKKDKELTEDMKKTNQEEIQKITDSFIKKVDTVIASKIEDIMSI